MCQLSFVNLDDPEQSRLLLYLLLRENSYVTHQDGTGFFNRECGVLKYPISGSNFLNLSEQIKGNGPFIGHVRLASTAFKSKKEKKYSHPFESADFVLAHNGTLTVKDRKDEKDHWKDLIDSQMFLEVLQEQYTKNKSLTKALNSAMKLFTGKFAFLIYKKDTDKFYAVRGRTADLNVIRLFDNTGKNRGYVINTELETLKKALIIYNNFLYTLYGYQLDWKKTMDSKVELGKEEIFELTNDWFKRIGDIRENYPVASHTGKGAYSSGSYFFSLEVMEENFTKQAEELDILDLNYLDELVFHLLGKGFSSMDDEDIKLFNDIIFPALKELKKRKGPKAFMEWRLIKKHCNPIKAHTDFGLQFPWPVNDLKELSRVRREIIKQDEKAINA